MSSVQPILAPLTGAWIVVLRDSYVGLFREEAEAHAYIEEAHDPDDECGSCDHITLDDVEDASVAYLNLFHNDGGFVPDDNGFGAAIVVIVFLWAPCMWMAWQDRRNGRRRWH